MIQAVAKAKPGTRSRIKEPSPESLGRLAPVARAYGTDPRWLAVRTADFFGRLDFTGLTVLDVGAGAGLYASCLAALGAERVVALEPGLAGAADRAGALLFRRQRELGLTRLEPRAQSLQEFRSPAGAFDLICLLASINHLDENHVQTIHSSPHSQRAYTALLRPLATWLRPGGRLVLADVSRNHAFAPLLRLGLLKRHPFQPHIEWFKHQPPEVWLDLLAELGLEELSWRWSTNRRFRWLPGRLVDSPLAVWLYSPLFIIQARRPLGPPGPTSGQAANDHRS